MAEKLFTLELTLDELLYLSSAALLGVSVATGHDLTWYQLHWTKVHDTSPEVRSAVALKMATVSAVAMRP